MIFGMPRGAKPRVTDGLGSAVDPIGLQRLRCPNQHQQTLKLDRGATARKSPKAARMENATRTFFPLPNLGDVPRGLTLNMTKDHDSHASRS